MTKKTTRAKKPKWDEIDAETLRRNVGQRVRFCRDTEGLRPFAARTGITHAYLCRIESGTVDLSLSVLQKLSLAIGEPLAEFLDGIETAHYTKKDYSYDGPNHIEGRKQEKEDEKERAARDAEWQAELLAKYPGKTLNEAQRLYEEEIEESIDQQGREMDEAFARHREYMKHEPEREAERQRQQAKDEKMQEEIVKHGLHAMAKKHHPDAGGSTEQMQIANRAAASLKETLAQQKKVRHSRR